MDRLTRDGIELVEYLCERFQRDRIFLLANSFGTTFGMDIARRRPDLLYAYIGADQNVGMVRERDETQREIIERLRAAGCTNGARALERIGSDPTCWSPDDFTAAARWTMKSDPQGFRRTTNFLKDSIWYAPRWKLNDIRMFVSGMKFSLEQLLPEASRYDGWRQGTRFEIPIFIYQGENDVLLPPKLARTFFMDLIAPSKRMTLIPNTGHFAVFQRPEQVLAELLTHARPLAEGTPRDTTRID